ncbi:MAG: response regulator [candidate division Zixibacteria bacterium]|nr:response regulator [candidate division Zixibacteria bacterium]
MNVSDTHSAQDSITADQLADLTVLIVDDEKSVLKALRRSLADENYRILTADTPQKALELLSNNRVAVVISDFNMPGLSGADLLGFVKTKLPRCIRIMLSGAAETDVVPDAVAKDILHCQKFITKPWDDIKLVAMIRECLAQYRSSCEGTSSSSTESPKPETGNLDINQELVCRSCQATLEPTWVICPYCGEK